ncbi:MAG: bifunctional methylenetetrahydrofolate dehydrogenase/methenyltetrahydrofolate cyclohydrolase FolD [Caldilineales bacterium]
MTATLIDGSAIAADIRQSIAARTAELTAKTGRKPGLATVLVGEDPASQAYVRMKGKNSLEVGFESFSYKLPAESTQEEVESLVRDLNANPAVNGILVQLPLPKHLNEEAILSVISLEKDVDGFHPVNIGRLVMKGRKPLFIPCTPKGCMVLLERSGVMLEGANAVVLGRSNIVGMPVAALLLHANATVTTCHSRSKDLPGICREADVLVAAVGRPGMVRGDWIKPGAVVIDVGVNRVDDASKKSGYRLVGDVNFDEAVEVAGMITPVPKGVGPMTIAMLLQNTLDSFERTI